MPSIAVTHSFLATPKPEVVKNVLGLSLNLSCSQPKQHAVIHLSANIPGDDTQYIYIPAGSPFYQTALPPRTPTYHSFSSFAFACDALVEEDSRTPAELFDNELQRIQSQSKITPASTFHLQRKAGKVKVSKNPGLSLNLVRDSSYTKQRAIIRRRSTNSATTDSLSNTPELESSSNLDSDSDGSDDDGEDVQYVYIPAESPFYTCSATRTSACLSLTGIPFACDALTEEDPLFVKNSDELYDGELQRSAPGDVSIFVVDPESFSNGLDSQITEQWSSIELEDDEFPFSTDQMKPAPVVYEGGAATLRQYL